MNLNDFDAGEGPTTPEERRTAQLCAYLFDELDAPERAELETALAADAELSAELESLRDTIGLVRGQQVASASSAPRLSATAMATLTAQAAGPKLSTVAPPLKRGALLQGIFNNAGRLAAASLVLTGGTLAFLQNRTLSGEPEATVARYEATEAGAADLNGELFFKGSGEIVIDPNLESSASSGFNPSSLPQLMKRKTNSQEADPSLDLHDKRLLSLAATSMPTASAPTDGLAALGREVQVPSSPELILPDANVWSKLAEQRAKKDFVGKVSAPTGLGGGGSGSYRGPGDVPPPGTSGPSSPGPGAPARDGQASRLSLGLSSVQKGAPGEFTAGRLATTTTAVTGAAAPPAESTRTRLDLGTVAATRAPARELPRSERGRTTKSAPNSEARKKAELQQRLGALGYGGGDEEEEASEEALGGFYDEGADGVRLRSADKSRGLSLEERARRLADQWIAHCQPVQNERPRDMYFRFWGDNPYVFSSQDKLATFAADVDTASYTLARRYLVDGVLPSKEQIRTEEFVNAFKPDMPAPAEETFAVTTELAPSPFGGSDSRWMMRVTVRGKEVSREERQPLAITFVVDTSGSMKEGKRLELVKHALRLLVSQLDARDSIALVAFSNEARLILPMTSAAQRGVIEAAIFPLKPDGGTNAEAGLKLGYELAATGLATGVHNRVVFLSDGVANLGQTNQDQLSADVKHRRDQGIYLNTIGVGMGNHNDVFLERLADQGDGICDYVDDAAAVERAIVERFTGAFIPIASDVKIQVEFDPTRVLRYRQIGYENRAVADADFRNDAVDAGEIGAGHQVTALFEIERVGSDVSADAGPLATVRLRWKEPKGAGKDPNEARVTEVEHTLASKQALGIFESASAGFQRAVLVAQFSEVLRRSNHAQGDSYDLLVSEIQRVRSLPAWANDADTKELLALVIRAGNLGAGKAPQQDDLTQVIDEYRRHQYLRSQLDGMQQQVGGVELKQLQDANDRLELRIRDLCLQQLR
ncbi:MAG: Ca-activated chloride channel family protein [Planctomycetota bacterium]|jgi:Ca-activated chloride channel family protein